MSQLKLSVYQIVWLIASALILVSAFLTFVYDRTLIAVMQDFMPRMFDIFQNPNEANIAVTFSSIGFIAIIIGGLLSILYAILAYENSKIWTAPRIVRIWNTSVLCLFGVILFSCPILTYINGNLSSVVAFIGAQYSPTFEGFGIGFFLMWISVIVSLIAGNGVINCKKFQPKTSKQVEQTPK